MYIKRKKFPPQLREWEQKSRREKEKLGKDHSKWWKGQNGKPKSYVEENSRKYHGELYLMPKKSVVACEPRWSEKLVEVGDHLCGTVALGTQ